MKYKLFILFFITGVLTFMNSQPTMLPVKLQQDSLFEHSQEIGLEYVLRLNPDRLMAPCYTALNKSGGSRNYGGWESRQIAGHSLGHYLSALAGFIQSTGDERCVEKLNYTVKKLKEIQRGDGYLGGVPSTPFDQASSGDFNVDRFGLAGYWVPWYSVHKIYAGLIDAYTEAGNKDALVVVTKMADWAVKLFKNTPEERFQKMLTCEHGGMCKVMADLYGITKNKDYLELAEKFIHKEIMTSAMREKDNLQGYHANTQIPKFIGIARLYELTGKPEYRTAAEFFFNVVTEQRSYSIGGNSIGEHFGPAYQERTGRDTCETCNTYNMLELAEHIFSWNPNVKIANFYETALYNHILASQEPVKGSKMYFVSTESGHFKVYGTDENAFWCCTGTGMENPERYNRFIWEQQKDDLYLNLFVSSSLDTNKFKLELITDFPYSDTITVKVIDKKDDAPSLFIRKPEWVNDEIKIMNGTQNVEYTKTENGYLKITSNLKKGDVLTFKLPMKLKIRKTQDSSGNFSILYGPIVLGATLGTRNMPTSDIVDDQLSLMNYPGQHVSPIVADLRNPSSWIKMTDADKLVFEADTSDKKNKILTLKPFFDIHHERYAIYFNGEDVADSARTKKYKNRVIDMVEAGRQQPEIEHRFKSEKSDVGYQASVDKSWRSATGSGAYFSYSLKLEKNKNNVLVITYYGKEEAPDGKKRAFKILAGDKVLATETPKATGVDDVYDVEYKIPAALAKKPRITIRFEPVDENSVVGNIYEVRTVKDLK